MDKSDISAIAAVSLVACLSLAEAAAADVQRAAGEARAAPSAAATPPGKVLAVARLSQQQIESLLQEARPLPTPQLTSLPAEAHRPIHPLVVQGRAAEPEIVAGDPGPKTKRKDHDEGEDAPTDTHGNSGNMTPLDHGRTKLNTVYHYTDRLVDPELQDDVPYRSVGWLQFVASDGLSYRCTAQLISRSIGLTAGHCVHDGGNGAAGWIKSGTFTPAYRNGSAPYGSAEVHTVHTTNGWLETGAFDAGYDIGIFTLAKRTGTSKEIGTYTGYSGFCVKDCLHTYWYLTQLGYPGNYYNGTAMTQGEHLGVSDTRDYVYGSGMEGGSSGGGLFANLGELANVSPGSLGRSPSRNIVFATTSWGWTDRTLKVQGASSLSGPGNSNKFKELFNKACTQARALHGAASCSILP
jgi:V8-like Glu-specific endopeptidase